MFNTNMLLVTLFLASALVHLVAAQEQCQTCMRNFVLCIDVRRYYICPDGHSPARNMEPLTCAEDEVCTTSPNICVKSDQVTAPITIPCASSCGTCPTDTTKRFTCVSKTQFALCSGTQTTSIMGSCSNDQICSMNSYMAGGPICIPECVADDFGYEPTCASGELITTTTTTTTRAPTLPPNRASLQQQCENARVNNPSVLYYFISNTDDTSCRSYIYCESTARGVVAYRITCQNGYFDERTRRCVTVRPASCSV